MHKPPRRVLFTQKHRVDAKLVHCVNENQQIVTQEFAHGLVFHRRIRAAAETIGFAPVSRLSSGDKEANRQVAF